MPKSLRKLFFLPVLAFAFAILAGAPEPLPAAPPTGCWIEYDACPDGFYDCCCGSFQSCSLTATECARACGWWA